MAELGLTARSLEMLLGDWRNSGAAYEALAERVRLLILDGRIAVDTRLPRARCVFEPSVFVVADRLAEVPDVPLLVLRVPVVGVFDNFTLKLHRVPHDGGAHAHDLFGFVRDDHLGVLGTIFGLCLVAVASARRKRVVGIRDSSNEVARREARAEQEHRFGLVRSLLSRAKGNAE